MKTYGRVVQGNLIDVTTMDPTEQFHPDVAAEFIEVPNGVLNGATKVGSTWANPIIEKETE